jgi:excisionase family DNA binding protein
MTEALTTTRLAELAGVHQTTILKAVQAGKIPARKTPGGHFRIEPREAVEFLRSMGIDPGPLTRRKVQVLALVTAPSARERVREALRSDPRFTLVMADDPMEAGILVERHAPDLVVVEADVVRDHLERTLRLLRELDVKVLVLEAPVVGTELLARLRELAEGTRVWKRAVELKA